MRGCIGLRITLPRSRKNWGEGGVSARTPSTAGEVASLAGVGGALDVPTSENGNASSEPRFSKDEHRFSKRFRNGFGRRHVGCRHIRRASAGRPAPRPSPGPMMCERRAHAVERSLPPYLSGGARARVRPGHRPAALLLMRALVLFPSTDRDGV